MAVEDERERKKVQKLNTVARECFGVSIGRRIVVRAIVAESTFGKVYHGTGNAGTALVSISASAPLPCKQRLHFPREFP